MRYLKVFKAPIIAFVVIISMVIFRGVRFEKNSKETLDITPSNCTISDTVSKEEPEGIINVETSYNRHGVFSTVVYADSVSFEDYLFNSNVDEVSPVETEQQQPIEAPVEQIKESNDAKTDSNSYSGGVEKTVPSGRGSNHTFMGWQMITCKSSNQYKLRTQSGENYDANGFGKVGNRYVVAVKPYYGNIGDYIDVYKSNGEVIKCIIGDAKGSDGGGDKYGHADGSIIEFVVDKYSWYSKYNGLGRYRTVGEFHPTWTSSNITKIVNVGNYWG